MAYHAIFKTDEEILQLPQSSAGEHTCWSLSNLSVYWQIAPSCSSLSVFLVDARVIFEALPFPRLYNVEPGLWRRRFSRVSAYRFCSGRANARRRTMASRQVNWADEFRLEFFIARAELVGWGALWLRIWVRCFHDGKVDSGFSCQSCISATYFEKRSSNFLPQSLSLPFFSLEPKAGLWKSESSYSVVCSLW